MSGDPSGAASVPAVLAWVLEWIAVPATMLWLWLRWTVWGPVPEKPGALTLDERRAARDGTLAGSALALVAFLILCANQTPAAPPEFPGTPADSIERLRLSAGGAIFLAAGLLAGMLPRAVRHGVRNSNNLKWLRSFALAVWLASGVAIFSLLAYFEWKDAHVLLLFGFSGLATGYRMGPLFIRFLKAIRWYP